MAKKSSTEILFNEEYQVAILPGVNAIVSMSSATDSITRPTSYLEKAADSDPLAAWGDSNTFPQDVIADVRKDPELGTLLNKGAQLMYGSGLTFGKVAYKTNGEEYLTACDPQTQVKIADWLRKSNINRYLFEACKDLTWFYNVFPEVVLARDRSEIAQICVQPAEDCRWSKQNATSGAIESCFINANFAAGAKSTDPLTKKLAVLDPYYDAAGNLKNDKRGLNYIYPLSIPSPGNKYYQLADWNAIRVSGWLQVSQLIPKFKKALLENQITLKYHIQISDMYWTTKFGEWKNKTEEQRTAIKQTELQAISDTISGNLQSGKSFYSAFKTDFNLGKEMSLIKIDPIADPIKSGEYLEDGKDASLYKQAAVGIHPALTSIANSGALAGSNIREAYNLHILTIQYYQHLILEPLYLVRDYNGWGPDIEFRFKNSLMTTLDAGKETTQTGA